MGYLVALAFLAILASLAAAGFFMLRGNGDGANKQGRMAKALAIRIGISVVLFVCILVAWKLGYVRPTGIPLKP